eukprot:gnl/TRDRNA2_/TRDRNA2_42733_c0_seq1.p1 gnl/TRDRNA2_/TRDRNA2_42733_c0~~gnl/TRDRNA2_/TRDRNA2_42733_c0_seq1.p1  ORF type:complete len:563 (-),score=162.67 gnl/TRDRNA2_/TRDRNA2_42733_c0_seq1:114-1802(-)
MARSVQLTDLPQELNDCVYTSNKYPLVIDPTGAAGQFLKYRSRYLSAFKSGDFDKESLRKGLVQSLHAGTWLVLDFDKLDYEISQLFVKDFFPEAVLSPDQLFLEETYTPLTRPTDEFAAKVTYEHSAALAQGAFQDRTVAHAPERVADVNKDFDPKEGFRLIVLVKKEEGDTPKEMKDQFQWLKLQVSDTVLKEGSSIWGGGERPKQKRSKEQQKLDDDLLEEAFDGNLDEVKKLLDNGADSMARNGQEMTPLSEAAVQGHLEVVRFLLEWKKPVGSDPNAWGSNGRLAIHRAAFQGHHETVQLLLEHGSDPRVKDRQGEIPFDMASNDETRNVLNAWDVKKTDELKEERKKAMELEDEKLVKTDDDRIRLERRRKMEKMAEMVKENEKDLLEIELMDITPSKIPTYRDDKGNTLLHIAAEHGRHEVIASLIEEFKMDVNLRDSKGWTPVAIAAFRGHKKACQELMMRKAQPDIQNAYRKSAIDVAQDDEIRQVLITAMDISHPASGSGLAAARNLAAGEDEKAEGKAEGKAKAKAKADAKAEAKPKAGGKAKAKAGGKKK